MDLPPDIAFRHVQPTAALKRIIHEGIDSLDNVHPRITTCTVMVEEASRGVPHIRLHIGIPGSDLVVNREVPDDPASRNLPSAVRDAFDVA